MTDTGTEASSAKPGDLKAFNYCLGFIDLLGQRDAVRGQNLLPTLVTEEDKEAFQATIRDSIVAIRGLQTQAETMLGGLIDGSIDSTFRERLSEKEQPIWDEMQRTKIIRQRWSDGLAIFVCLGDQEVKCHMNGIFGIFALCGSLCYLGLATHRPVRGAIDVAWGVELHPDELYGPVVARAYELESDVAQYPRIVVGPNVVAMLKAHQAQPSDDVYSQLNRELAQLCSNMIIRDVDGFPIIHYLGDSFRDAITQSQHQDIYDGSHKFVIEQLQQHQKAANSKLAFRYSHLLQYFQAYPPPSEGADEA